MTVEVIVSLMDWIETHRDLVYPWQCDHMGHMNVMYYTSMFDRATWHLFARIGVTAEYVRDLDHGLVAVHSATDYRRELLPGDLVVIRSRLLEVGKRKVVFEHVMDHTTTGETCATNRLIGVHLNLSTRQSAPFPASIHEAAQALLADA